MTPRERLLIACLLFVVLMIGMTLRLYELDADSLWFDEVYSANRAQQGLRSLLTYSAAYQHPPLGDIITWFVTALLGNSDFVLRLPALLFGSLSTLLVFKAGTILWTRQVALVSAFLLAVNALHIEHSQQARPYAQVAFLALLSLILLLKALHTNKRGLWLGFVLATSLALYTHYFAFLFLAAEVVFAVWMVAEKGLAPKIQTEETPTLDAARRLSVPASQAVMLPLSLALIGFSYLPWIARLRVHSAEVAGLAPTAAIMTDGLQSSLGFLHEVFSAYSGGTGVGLVLSLGLFVVGLMTCERNQIALLILWVSIPFGFLAVLDIWHILNPRYLLFALPIYLLAISKGVLTVSRWLDRALRSARRGQSWHHVLVPALALMLGIFNVASLRNYYLSQNADWRRAAGYLAVNAAMADIILADGKEYSLIDDYWVDICLSYYFGAQGIANPEVLPVNGQLWDNLEAVRRNNGEVWAVLGYKDRPRSWDSLDQITVTDFHDVAIIRLREPSGDILQDTKSILEMMLELLPPEAQFDVHLALAQIYVQTEAFEQARSQLEMASQVQPDKFSSPRALADAFAELERLSQPEDVYMQYPLWRSLGEVIAFLGYSIRPSSIQGGDTLHVALFWQALERMDRDYSVFIHLVGPNDRRWAQADRVLRQVQHGGYPTSSWQMEEKVREQYELVLAPDTPPGEYIIKAGIYYWETGERLPVWDDEGHREPDDTIQLGPIAVTQ